MRGTRSSDPSIMHGRGDRAEVDALSLSPLVGEGRREASSGEGSFRGETPSSGAARPTSLPQGGTSVAGKPHRLTAHPSRPSSTASSRPSAKKLQRRALHARRASPLPCATATSRSQRRDTRDADGGVPRTVGHRQDHSACMRPGMSGDPDHLARRERREALADQIEIGDAIDFVVIGDAAVAIAEADLRPHVDLDVVAARIARAAKRAARRPAVARKRPGDFPPVRSPARPRRGCDMRRRRDSAPSARPQPR